MIIAFQKSTLRGFQIIGAEATHFIVDGTAGAISAVAASAGIATVSAVSSVTSAQVGNSSGVATAAATSSFTGTVNAVGNSAGVATAAATSAATSQQVGNSDGTNTAAAIGAGGLSTTRVVGWIGSRLRHKPEELERRLKEQRSNTFSRQRFDEMIEEAKELAAEVKSKKARKALNNIAATATRAADAANDNYVDDGLVAALDRALLSAISAENTARMLSEIKIAHAAANEIIRVAAENEEEDEIAMLLAA